jgi:alginate O-acetyltransferase complex protein AlgI
MLFNSFHFLVFFVVTVTLYFTIDKKFRNSLLLIASCYFYMAYLPVYILILGFTIAIDFFAGKQIEKAHGHSKKIWLTVSIISNIGILAVFKYYNFLNDNLTFLLDSIGVNNSLPALKILLPVGLSFHTFQALSYIIEVYRGNYKAERNFLDYALYVIFFPQLVAGPIEKPQRLLFQFKQSYNFDAVRVSDGIRLIIWGLIKKVVVADRLSVITDKVFDSPDQQSGFALVVGMISFSFQIFCDFSGYSDIAVGTARILGIDLMKNFNLPYRAKSIGEFWNRWHISLSHWFRDYLFIPMGGSRVKVPKWILNIFIVFMISGLWHGAAWTFIAWGALHGFYLVFAKLTMKGRQRLSEFFHINNIPYINEVTVFLLVSFAWIFFRAKNFDIAFSFITNLFRKLPQIPSDILNGFPSVWNLGIPLSDFFIAAGLIIFLIMVHSFHLRFNVIRWIKSRPTPVRMAIYYACIFLILFVGIFENRQFIYFQF